MATALAIVFTGTAAGDTRSHLPDFPTVPGGGSVTLSWKVTGASARRLLWIAEGSGAQVLEADLAAEGTRAIEGLTAPGRWRLEATSAAGSTLSKEVQVELAELHEASPVASVEAHAGLDALPLLVCGPLLRRVSPPEDGQSKVSVFFAAKEPLTAQLKLRRQGSATWLDPSPAAETVPLGPFLHACVVTGAFPLEAGAVFEYDLVLPGERGLAAAGVVVKGNLDCELGDAPGALPSFLAPPATLEELRVVHGSCRKSSGDSADALALVGPLISDPARRPHQLILTGDQIYADEVAPSLLALVRDRAKLLLGADQDALAETLPSQDDTVPAYPFAALGVDVDRGVKVLSRLKGWEDKKGSDGHLLFLHEFAAMYLMAFSPALWEPASFPAELAPLLGHHVLKAAKKNPLARATRDRQRRQVLQFAAALGAVRRVLANVPVLMICDDHEVTDDWNIDSFFLRDLGRSPLQARIVRNALCAYAVFQDWGNRPELYEEGGLARPILDALRLGGSSGSWTSPAWRDDKGAAAAQLDRLLLPLGAGTTKGEAPPEAGADDPPHHDRSASGGALSWNYALTYPSHRLLVLDTRTRRHFPDKPDTRWLPQLISAASLDEQLPAPEAGLDLLDLVVSATPVFGQPAIETALEIVRAHGHGSRETDQEDWACSRVAQYHATHKLGRNRRTVVLSGDVHYAFSLAVNATMQTDNGPKKARLIQLCSSSLHHADLTSHLSAGANGPIPGKDSQAAPPEHVGEDSAAPSPEDRELGERLKLERVSAAGSMQRVEPATLRANGAAIPLPNLVVPYNNVGLVSFSTASGMTKVKHQLFWPFPKKEHHLFESAEANQDLALELPFHLLFLLGFKVGVTVHELEVNRPDGAHFEGSEKPPAKVTLEVPYYFAPGDRPPHLLKLAGGNVSRTLSSDDTGAVRADGEGKLIFRFADVPAGTYSLFTAVGGAFQKVASGFEVAADTGAASSPAADPKPSPEPVPDAPPAHDASAAAEPETDYSFNDAEA